MTKHGYRYRLYLDNLPSATMVREEETGKIIPNYDDGIPVGVYNEKDDTVMLYNHLSMTVLTHFEGGSDKQRIVGFEIEPQSIHFDTHGTSEGVVVTDNHESENQFVVTGE